MGLGEVLCAVEVVGEELAQGGHVEGVCGAHSVADTQAAFRSRVRVLPWGMRVIFDGCRSAWLTPVTPRAAASSGSLQFSRGGDLTSVTSSPLWSGRRFLGVGLCVAPAGFSHLFR